jgi:hypothetical protein
MAALRQDLDGQWLSQLPPVASFQTLTDFASISALQCRFDRHKSLWWQRERLLKGVTVEHREYVARKLGQGQQAVSQLCQQHEFLSSMYV